jgi:release factor glutamine methyltransferase
MITAKQLYQTLLHQLIEEDENEKKAIARAFLLEKVGITSVDILTDKVVQAFDFSEEIHRLNQGEPLQYVVGSVEFGDHTFLCGPGVLIPRPETEELFYVLRSLGPFSYVLDIGTGTGCLAHSISKAFPEAYVEAWDVSPEALLWAERNKQHTHSSVHLKQRDIFDAMSETSATWDLIVSNPPYIVPSEKKSMHHRVLHYEPSLALFAPEEDPLLFYRAITRYAKGNLISGGILAFEINQRYGKEVVALLQSSGFTQVQLHQDIPGKDRLVLGRR